MQVNVGGPGNGYKFVHFYVENFVMLRVSDFARVVKCGSAFYMVVFNCRGYVDFCEYKFVVRLGGEQIDVGSWS